MPTDYVPITPLRRWYQRPLPWIAITLALCLALLAIPKVFARFKRWDQQRRLTRAENAFRSGDYQRAVLGARRVLQADPHNGGAKRLVALSLEAVKSPDAASWWRELDRTNSGTSENIVGLAEASLRTGDFVGAAMHLERLRAEERTGVRFHELSARTAIGRKESAAAMRHLREILKIAPDRDDVRFELARLQLDTDAAEERRAGVETLEELAEKPGSQLASLRVLLEDAIRTGARAAAIELSQRLIDAPGAAFADRLLHLDVLRAGREPGYSAQLDALQTRAASEPEEIAQLIGWMIDNELALEIPAWTARLAAEITEAPPVAPAIAETLVRTAAWERLRSKVESESWEAMDFLRQAFRARAAQKLGDGANEKIAWDAALALIQTRPDAAEMLAKAALRWGWDARAEEALWKRAESPRCPRWAADHLFAASLRRGDMAALQRASELIVKLQPDDLETRNNHLYLTLLADPAGIPAREVAAKLREANPRNARIAATHAFSLLQQDRIDDAARVFEGLPAEDLAEPQVARIRAAVLAAAGDAARAAELFEQSSTRRLLPAEKVWFDSLAAMSRCRLLTAHGESAPAEAVWQRALSAAAAHPALLAILSRLATDWQWPERTEQILWIRAGLRDCPIAVLDTLRQHALQRGDLAALCKVSRLRRTALPNDPLAQSEFTYFLLLAGEDREVTLRRAASQHRDHPTHPGIATAFALASIQTGRAPEAITALERLGADCLREPRAALCYGLALADTGREARAAQSLALAAGATLLPAERALLESRRPLP